MPTTPAPAPQACSAQLQWVGPQLQVSVPAPAGASHAQEGAEPPAAIRLLPLHLNHLSLRFKAGMHSALDLEYAIAEVEDAISPTATWLAALNVRQLSTSDPLFTQVATVATGLPIADTPLIVTREAVEALYQRQARQAESAAWADRSLPASAPWAATALVLRECMQHWDLRLLWASKQTITG